MQNIIVRLGIATLWMAVLLCPMMSQAVETAPRISDREIIESLAELKAGQQTLQQQLTDLKQSTQQQIADFKQSTQQQIADFKQSTQQQTDHLQQSFQDLRQEINRRFDDLMILLRILIGTLALVLGGILAWLIAIWRRLVRVEERQRAFETQDDEIKFLKENYSRLHQMLSQLVARLP
jgi:ABC-type transport system involved in cytochrome bd biosynthesis fused ATPase/permease subunit